MRRYTRGDSVFCLLDICIKTQNTVGVFGLTICALKSTLCYLFIAMLPFETYALFPIYRIPRQCPLPDI